jgi:hypothetical protein
MSPLQIVPCAMADILSLPKTGSGIETFLNSCSCTWLAVSWNHQGSLENADARAIETLMKLAHLKTAWAQGFSKTSHMVDSNLWSRLEKNLKNPALRIGSEGGRTSVDSYTMRLNHRVIWSWEDSTFQRYQRSSIHLLSIRLSIYLSIIYLSIFLCIFQG